ncbi:MAG: acetolactate synthase small subunit [Candidatus Omnitrophota bacterium]|jgi:acetolactate synthase-1/3 small subunit
MRHTISISVENKFGVLARIAGLFSARGYNITSLSVSETLDPSLSYLTMVVDTKDEKILEQVKKQLNKLIDVISVTDFTKKDYIDRELMMIKVSCGKKDKAALESLAKRSGAGITHCRGNTAIIEIAGDQEKLKKVLEEAKRFNIKELVRAGKIAMATGDVTKKTAV